MIDNKKIVFKILSVKGGVVRIGISAEQEINIARGEIYVEQPFNKASQEHGSSEE